MYCFTAEFEKDQVVPVLYGRQANCWKGVCYPTINSVNEFADMAMDGLYVDVA